MCARVRSSLFGLQPSSFNPFDPFDPYFKIVDACIARLLPRTATAARAGINKL
jgi:hypothetical protein